MTPTTDPQAALVARYRAALADYDRPAIRAACAALGMDAREYCDRFARLNFPPLVGLATTASTRPFVYDPEGAWDVAWAEHRGGGAADSR